MLNVDALSYEDIWHVIQKLVFLDEVYHSIVDEYILYYSDKTYFYTFDLTRVTIDIQKLYNSGSNEITIEHQIPEAYNVGNYIAVLPCQRKYIKFIYCPAHLYPQETYYPKHDIAWIDHRKILPQNKKLPPKSILLNGLMIGYPLLDYWINAIGTAINYYLALLEPLVKRPSMSPTIEGDNITLFVFSDAGWRSVFPGLKEEMTCAEVYERYQFARHEFELFLAEVKRAAFRHIPPEVALNRIKVKRRTSKDYLTAMAAVIVQRTQKSEPDMRAKTIHQDIQERGIYKSVPFDASMVAHARAELSLPPFNFRFKKRGYRLEDGCLPQLGEISNIILDDNS